MNKAPGSGDAARLAHLEGLIRTIPDFPKKGVMFRDVTTLLADPAGLKEAVQLMAAAWRGQGVNVVVAIEARGFFFGAPLAMELGTGVVPARKPGKLPWRCTREEYALEYGTDALEMHEDAVGPGARVLVVDDLLATGGTAAATISLVRRMGADVVGASFLVELGDLGGRARLAPVPISALITFAGE